MYLKHKFKKYKYSKEIIESINPKELKENSYNLIRIDNWDSNYRGLKYICGLITDSASTYGYNQNGSYYAIAANNEEYRFNDIISATKITNIKENFKRKIRFYIDLPKEEINKIPDKDKNIQIVVKNADNETEKLGDIEFVFSKQYDDLSFTFILENTLQSIKIDGSDNHIYFAIQNVANNEGNSRVTIKNCSFDKTTLPLFDSTIYFDSCYFNNCSLLCSSCCIHLIDPMLDKCVSIINIGANNAIYKDFDIDGRISIVPFNNDSQYKIYDTRNLWISNKNEDADNYINLNIDDEENYTLSSKKTSMNKINGQFTVFERIADDSKEWKLLKNEKTILSVYEEENVSLNEERIYFIVGTKCKEENKEYEYLIRPVKQESSSNIMAFDITALRNEEIIYYKVGYENVTNLLKYKFKVKLERSNKSTDWSSGKWLLRSNNILRKACRVPFEEDEENKEINIIDLNGDNLLDNIVDIYKDKIIITTKNKPKIILNYYNVVLLKLMNDNLRILASNNSNAVELDDIKIIKVEKSEDQDEIKFILCFDKLYPQVPEFRSFVTKFFKQ